VDVALLDSSQMVGNRYYEINCPVPFSYIPPEGWQLHLSDQSRPATWIGPEQSRDGQLVLYISCEANAGAPEQIAQNFLDQLTLGGMTFSVHEEGAFPTESDGAGYRILFQVTDPTGEYFAGWYAFSNGNALILPGYFRVEGENPEQDEIIFRSMTSLRFESR
jgi:hypothetical protein